MDRHHDWCRLVNAKNPELGASQFGVTRCAGEAVGEPHLFPFGMIGASTNLTTHRYCARFLNTPLLTVTVSLAHSEMSLINSLIWSTRPLASATAVSKRHGSGAIRLPAGTTG